MLIFARSFLPLAAASSPLAASSLLLLA